MLFTTPTQWVALAVALVAGWLLGLASAPGGKKWKARYLAERDAHAELRKAQAARVAELERDNHRLAREAPVTERTVVERPVATDRATPAVPADRHRL